MPFLGARGQVSRGYFGGGTTPNQPTALSSIPGNGQLTISFTDPSFNGGLTITNYQYALSTNGSSYGSWTAFSPVDTISPVVISGLTNGTQYFVKLRAVNALGAGAESSVLSTDTTPRTIPAKVGTPTSEAGDRSFTIRWSAPNDGGSAITGYRYQLSSNGGATWGSTATTTETSHTWTLENDGTSYVGRVQAYNVVGNGDYSDASTAKTPAFQSSGTISATEQAVDVPFYDETSGALVLNGLGTQNQRHFTVSFDPPNVSNFSHAKVYQSTDAVNWTEIKHVTSNGADSVTSNAVTPSTFGTTNSAVYFKMITWNTNDNHVESARVDRTASAYQFYYFYDTSNRTHDSGVSFVDSRAYSNDINSAEFGTDSKIISVSVFASSETGTATICTLSRHFRYAWKAGTDYGSGFTVGSGLVAPFTTNTGTTYRSLNIGASTGYGTGMRFKVLGHPDSTIVSGWVPRIRVFYRITYRNRYVGSW